MSIWRKLFGQKDQLPENEQVKDLRSDKEREIERSAYAGESLGTDLDGLVAELIEIGRTDGYLSTSPGGKFNEKKIHIRTCEIGKALNERGGNDLMIKAAYRVRAALPHKARSLEMAWDGIG